MYSGAARADCSGDGPPRGRPFGQGRGAHGRTADTRAATRAGRRTARLGDGAATGAHAPHSCLCRSVTGGTARRGAVRCGAVRCRARADGRTQRRTGAVGRTRAMVSVCATRDGRTRAHVCACVYARATPCASSAPARSRGPHAGRHGPHRGHRAASWPPDRIVAAGPRCRHPCASSRHPHGADGTAQQHRSRGGAGATAGPRTFPEMAAVPAGRQRLPQHGRSRVGHRSGR